MPIAKAFRKQGGGSEESFTSQSNVEAAFGSLSRSIILDGVLLENIVITPAGVNVEHKLGRNYRGYIICKNNTYFNVQVYSEQNKNIFINLQAQSNCTLSLWVF